MISSIVTCGRITGRLPPESFGRVVIFFLWQALSGTRWDLMRFEWKKKKLPEMRIQVAEQSGEIRRRRQHPSIVVCFCGGNKRSACFMTSEEQRRPAAASRQEMPCRLPLDPSIVLSAPLHRIRIRFKSAPSPTGGTWNDFQVPTCQQGPPPPFFGTANPSITWVNRGGWVLLMTLVGFVWFDSSPPGGTLYNF